MIRNLEEKLQAYDKILLAEDSELFGIFGFYKVNLHGPGCGGTTTQESQACTFGIPECMPPNRRRTFKVMILISRFNLPQTEHVIFQRISEKKFQELLKLYFTYEFSDKFVFISGNNANYACLYHMVNMGILSPKEFVAALLS